MERTVGVEPTSTGWKPVARPLYHARSKLVEPEGVEPSTTGCKPVVFPLAPQPHKHVNAIPLGCPRRSVWLILLGD